MGLQLIKRNIGSTQASKERPQADSPSIHCAYDKLVPVDELKPHPRNPNKHPKEQIKLLAHIMKVQGIRRPIVVSTRSGLITIGHGRLEAAQLNGWAAYPVDFQEYESEAMEYADMVADNKIAELSEVDMAMVNADFVQFGPDFDVDLLGIPGFEIEPLDAMKGNEDEAPKLPAIPKTKLGDLYILGRHRLLCGDATNKKHTQALMNGETADMVFTDPPYNVDYEGKTEDALKIKNDKMGDSEFRDFLLKVFKNYQSVSKPGSAIYVCHADSNGLTFRSTLVEAGWLLKQCLVWVKQQFVMGRQDYHWQHEPILYGWMPGAAHHWFGNRKQSTVWQFDRPMKSLEHPTMKPVEMIQHALLNSSKKDDLVLDFFGGSGSTMIACEKTKRRCFTMELDPKYCDVVVTRWEKYTGEKAKRIRKI